MTLEEKEAAYRESLINLIAEIMSSDMKKLGKNIPVELIKTTLEKNNTSVLESLYRSAKDQKERGKEDE